MRDDRSFDVRRELDPLGNTRLDRRGFPPWGNTRVVIWKFGIALLRSLYAVCVKASRLNRAR